MEYQYEVKQEVGQTKKSSCMKIDGQTLLLNGFYFLIIVGIPYTAYVVVQFILSF